MPLHNLVVFTNPAPGRNAEFNTWYDEVHLRDVLGVDGFVAAQRFRLAEAQLVDDRSFEYLAIYEIEADDVGAALEALNSGSSSMVISDALDKTTKALAFTAIGQRIEG